MGTGLGPNRACDWTGIGYRGPVLGVDGLGPRSAAGMEGWSNAMAFFYRIGSATCIGSADHAVLCFSRGDLRRHHWSSRVGPEPDREPAAVLLDRKQWTPPMADKKTGPTRPRPPNTGERSSDKVHPVSEARARVPAFMKNYLIVLAGVPLPLFMGISTAVTLPYLTAFVIMGGLVEEHDWKHLVWVGAAVVGLVGIGWWARRRWSR